MTFSTPEKAGVYRRARNIGLSVLVLQTIVLLFLTGSRVLGADTVHCAIDVLLLAGTALLLGRIHRTPEIFARRYRAMLLFGVWSLALGGIAIGAESLTQIVWSAHSGKPGIPWALLAIAAIGGLGNWKMHRVLSAVHQHHRNALDKNNIDHVFWDMLLSAAVFSSGLSMWIFETNAFDHYIAIAVGFIVLPYLALRRWRENAAEKTHKYSDGHEHADHHDDH